MIAQPTADIHVSRFFAFQSDYVFDAWFDQKIAGAWMFTTETGTNIRAEITPHVGGGFIITDRRPDMDVEHVGTYLEIDRPHRLVFTFGVPAFATQEDRVVVDVRVVPGGCEVTLTHTLRAEMAEYAPRIRNGWATMLDKLAEQLEKPRA